LLSHIVIALMIQAAVKTGLRTSWWAGAAAASCWAVSREITQAEYRWIEEFGSGLRANMPWWGGLDPKVWHGDAFFDWLGPSLAAFALACCLAVRRKSLRASTD
jgi:hypothetical protein